MLGKHRSKRTAVGRTFGRAIRWIDDWTVEAFNPVYPHHRRGVRKHSPRS